MRCMDGSSCSIKTGLKWYCCNAGGRGGRAQCPKGLIMCPSSKSKHRAQDCTTKRCSKPRGCPHVVTPPFWKSTAAKPRPLFTCESSCKVRSLCERGNNACRVVYADPKRTKLDWTAHSWPRDAAKYAAAHSPESFGKDWWKKNDPGCTSCKAGVNMDLLEGTCFHGSKEAKCKSGDGWVQSKSKEVKLYQWRDPTLEWPDWVVVPRSKRNKKRYDTQFLHGKKYSGKMFRFTYLLRSWSACHKIDVVTNGKTRLDTVCDQWKESGCTECYLGSGYLKNGPEKAKCSCDAVPARVIETVAQELGKF